MEPEQVGKIKASFIEADSNGDGKIDSKEVKLVLEKVLGEKVNNEVVDTFYEEVTKDKAGFVGLDEFLDCFNRLHNESSKEGEGSRKRGQTDLARFFKNLSNRQGSKTSVAADREALGKFVLSSESDKIKGDIVNLLNKYEVGSQKYVVFQIYINRIFAVDDVEQQINMDMYLKLNWRDTHWIGKTDEEFQETEHKPEWWAPGVEVSNAIDLEKQTEEEEAFWLEIPEDGILAYTQRYIGTVSTHMDLHQFPFDKQLITINFESFHWKESDMKMVVLPSFILQPRPPPGGSWKAMSNEVKLHDWAVDEIAVKEKPQRYEFEDRTYSRVQVRLKLARSYRYYFLRILVVIWLIVIMSWSVFFCDPGDLSGRLAITVTLFLAAVAFQFVIGSSLPKVPYNTLLDQHMLVSYAYIATTAIEEIIIYHVCNSGLNETADIIHGEWWFALTFALSYLTYNIQWVAVSLSVRHSNIRYRDPALLLEEEDEEEDILEGVDPSSETKDSSNLRLMV